MVKNQMVQVSFFNPNGQEKEWSGWEARKFVASRLDEMGAEGVNTLMHYNNQSLPLDEYPCIRFLGGRNGFRIVGIGDGVQTVLMFAQQYPYISEGKPCRVEINFGEVDCRPGKPFGYRCFVVPSVQRSSTKMVDAFQKGDISEAKFKEYLVSRIKTGIYRQMNVLGLDADPQLWINEVRVRGWVPYGTKGNVVTHVPRVEVGFVCDHQLVGQWSVGSLISRGHGYIMPVYKHSSEESENAA